MNSQENTINSKVERPQHGFQLVYYYSRCLGQWPFTIAYNANESIEKAHVNVFDWLWLFTAICLYVASAFCVYNYNFNYATSDADDFYVHFIITLSEVPSISLRAVGIVLNMLNRNRLVDILKNFVIFDRKVGFEK